MRFILVLVSVFLVSNAYFYPKCKVLLGRGRSFARNVENNEKSAGESSPNPRPAINPSDFARDDVKMPVDSSQNRDPQKIVEENLKKLQKEKVMAEIRSSYRVKERVEEGDDAMPTGYSNDSDDEDQLPLMLSLVDRNDIGGGSNSTANSTNNDILQFVQNVYIGSPTDPPRRQQARFVVRSITLISFVFGLAFTALWYLAPGKFVSLRGSDEAVSTSRSRTVDFYDSNSLLNIPTGTSEYMDDAEGLPEKERTRVPYPKTDDGEVIKSRQMDL